MGNPMAMQQVVMENMTPEQYQMYTMNNLINMQQ